MRQRRNWMPLLHHCLHRKLLLEDGDLATDDQQPRDRCHQLPAATTQAGVAASGTLPFGLVKVVLHVQMSRPDGESEVDLRARRKRARR